MKLPPIIYPSENIKRNRFVQLYINEDGRKIPLLALAEEHAERHGSILRRTLESLGLNFEILDDETLKEYQFPKAKSEFYEAAGMGWFDFVFKDGLFVAFGCSPDYALLPNEEQFRDLQKIGPKFKFRIDSSRY